MRRIKGFLMLAAVLALLLGNGFARAQTGPVEEKPKEIKPPAGQVQLDEKNFEELLQQLEFKVETRQNAEKKTYWIITTQQDGWGFVVEVQPQRNKQTKRITGFWLISDLGGSIINPAGLSAPALLKLMEKNHEMAPFFFSYNAASKHLAMNYEYPFGTIDQKGLKSQFDTLFGKIRETYSLWKNDALVAGGGALPPPIPGTAPVPGPAPVPNPGIGGNVAGTQWTGTETLEGYGKLTLQFAQGGKATMIDNDGVSQGTWTQTGNQVTVSFYQGQVSYKGTINGNVMTGTGINAATNWTFSLKKQN